MSTEFPSKNAITRQWHVLDAQEMVLGKLASKAAVSYTHLDVYKRQAAARTFPVPATHAPT